VRDELDVLLDRVADEVLRADLREQISRIRAKRSFGLVFESHLPERVLLPESLTTSMRCGWVPRRRTRPGSAK
jgi:hypothetical protein